MTGHVFCFLSGLSNDCILRPHCDRGDVSPVIVRSGQVDGIAAFPVSCFLAIFGTCDFSMLVIVGRQRREDVRYVFFHVHQC